MKLKTRLAIAFVTFSVLPIMFVGLMLSVGRLFMVYRMDEFGPEVKTMVAQLIITAVLMLMSVSYTHLDVYKRQGHYRTDQLYPGPDSGGEPGSHGRGDGPREDRPDHLCGPQYCYR